MALSFAVTPFVFPPNWSEDVLEHLEWKTDVLTAHDNTEQRRSLRTKARRSLEYGIQAVGLLAQSLEGLLFSSQNIRVATPFWTDRARSTSTLTAGSRTFSIQTVNYGFQPGQLICFYVSETQYEFARIAFMDTGSITVDENSGATWPEGTLVFPAGLAILPLELTATRHTSNALSANVTLIFSPDITYSFTPTDLPVVAVHGGVEVLTTQPNWRSAISNSIIARYDIADGQTGTIVQMQTSANTSRRTTQYAWLLKNRTEILEYRNFLGRRKGQLKSFFVPSWHDDFDILSTGVGNATVTVAGTNWINTGFTTAAIYGTLGEVAYSDFVIAVSGDDSTLTLTTPPAFIISKISILHPSRSLSDKVTLAWKSDSIVEATDTFTSGAGVMPPVAPTFGANATFSVVGSADLETTPAVSGDPYWSNVVALMPMRSDFNEIAKGAAVQTAGTVVPAGDYCIFDGSSWLTLDDSANWDFGTGDFTIECTIIRDAEAEFYPGLITQRNNGSDMAFSLLINEGFGGAASFEMTATNGTKYIANSAAPVAVGVESKIAVVRTGTSLRVYVNGVGGTSVNIGSVVAKDHSQTLRIGLLGNAANVNTFNGKMRDLRITKGVGRYDTNYTPTSDTFPTS